MHLQGEVDDQTGHDEHEVGLDVSEKAHMIFVSVVVVLVSIRVLLHFSQIIQHD